MLVVKNNYAAVNRLSKRRCYVENMFGALLVAAVTLASPSPLPIIITTKSSPICQALREKIAPAIARAVYEDRVMARQRPMERNAPIYPLALNWIKLDELLNPDTFFHSDNPAENARMESLRQRLQKVADDENNALNILSGAAYTYEFEVLQAEGDGLHGALGKELSKKDGTPDIVSHSGDLEDEFLHRESMTQQEELSVYPELQPLITQCSGSSPVPSASP